MQEKINFSDYSQIPDDLKQKMQKEDAEKTELILALDKKVQLLQKSNDLQKVIIDSYEAEKKRASIGSLIGTGIAGSVLTGLALKAKDADSSVNSKDTDAESALVSLALSAVKKGDGKPVFDGVVDGLVKAVDKLFK